MANTITLRDVARAAGVSTASASRAMARPESVSDELRGRILAAAGRLGYSPNLAARALVVRRSGLIGMLVDRAMDQLCVAAVAAADEALSRSGYSLVLATTGGTEEESEARGREMLGRGVEALVSWTAGKAAALERHVAGHRVPWVLFDQAVAGAPALAASSGRRSGAALACRYLLSLGHRRFGLLAAAGADMAEEVLGVLATTVATTLDAHPVASGADLDGAQTAVGELLDQGKATAIICASDLLALAALRECARRGVSVPAAISVVGFGDSPLARFGSPPVTSIRVSPEEIAARTVEALLLALAGGTPAAIETLPKLVIRESTGQATP